MQMGQTFSEQIWTRGENGGGETHLKDIENRGGWNKRKEGQKNKKSTEKARELAEQKGTAVPIE